MVDRFNNPHAPPGHLPFDGKHVAFQGGTIEGVRRQLGYLQELGVGAIWLSPVLKNCQSEDGTFHGYGIQDFLEIDPRFASDPAAARANPKLVEDELRALVDEAHARGMYVIMDIVLNHAGNVFAYVLDNGARVSAADFRDAGYTINWRDADGSPRHDWTKAPDDLPGDLARDAAVWPTELRRNEYFRRQGKGGEAGGDFESLKEFVSAATGSDPEQGRFFSVRNALIRAYQHMIAKYDVDGFRIDTLKFIERDFARIFGNAMREFALSIGKRNFFTFGEVYDNDEKIAHFIGRDVSDQGDLVGVDAALDFPLFFVLASVLKGRTAPAGLAAMYAHRRDVQRQLISSHGEASRYFVTFLDNHDQNNRFFFRPGDDPNRFADQLTMGVGALFCLLGIPCLYYGTEQGLHGIGGSDAAVREALWGKDDAFDPAHPFCSAIAQLSRVRREQPALRYGRQYFRPLSGDGLQFGISPFPAGVIAFSRILNNEEVLVVANTSTTGGFIGEVIVDFAPEPGRHGLRTALFKQGRAGWACRRSARGRNEAREPSGDPRA